MIRLDRFLANQGIGTRKEVKQLIRQQLVRIDGVLIERGDHKFDEERCVVTLRDEVIEHHKDVYLLFHKPAGCVCANHDPLHPTVFDHLPACYQRLSTVGRLDKDTTGLLLISDDGVLAHRLLTPSRHVRKGYEATLAKEIDDAQVMALTTGIDLGDFTTMPAEVQLIDAHRVRLYICEGKFHQVKRMFHAVGNEVTALHRFSFGPLSLGDLPQGEWRPLRTEEIEELKEVSRP